MCNKDELRVFSILTATDKYRCNMFQCVEVNCLNWPKTTIVSLSSVPQDKLSDLDKLAPTTVQTCKNKDKWRRRHHNRQVHIVTGSQISPFYVPNSVVMIVVLSDMTVLIIRIQTWRVFTQFWMSSWFILVWLDIVYPHKVLRHLFKHKKGFFFIFHQWTTEQQYSFSGWLRHSAHHEPRTIVDRNSTSQNSPTLAFITKNNFSSPFT